MTDRARDLLDNICTARDCPRCLTNVVAALAEAHRKGAESMRERLLEWTKNMADMWGNCGNGHTFDALTKFIKDIPHAA